MLIVSAFSETLVVALHMQIVVLSVSFRVAVRLQILGRRLSLRVFPQFLDHLLVLVHFFAQFFVLFVAGRII